MWFLVFLYTVLELNILWFCAKLGASVSLRELSAPCLDTENWTELCVLSAGPLTKVCDWQLFHEKATFSKCDRTRPGSPNSDWLKI